MKIDDPKGLLGPALVRLPGTRGPADPLGPRPGDRVSVSATARDLVQLRGDLGELDAVRQEKILGLRAVMANGSYSADVDGVARKVLRELLEDLLA